ncbi:hypothetical protein AB6825_22850 [Serratia proteamaculans]|jgi:uncharacterized protein (UPF0332 family)|uniref:hypothetical protein n=1 Tax=Serratia proteamaculans TaxID=28151 RepID=UPI0039BE6871|nr:hypothetical protein [Serratia marcescens]
MSVTGKDFHEFAQKCMSYDDEISYRNAIGRAYYGLYHEVCSALHNCPATSHTGVATYLQDEAWRGNEPYEKFAMKSLGIVLQQQHSKRKQCDYQIDLNVTKEDALESMKVTEKMLIKLQSMLVPKTA